MALVVLWFLFLIAYTIACGCIAGNIASKRDASYGAYFALGFFFGVIGVAAAAFAGGRSVGTSVVHHHHY